MTRASSAAVLVAAALAATVFAQNQSEVIKITAGRADIRSEPRANAPILRHAIEGSYLILIKEDAGWFHVQLPGFRGLRAIGYVDMKSAIRVKPAEAAAAIEAMNRPVTKAPPGDTIAVGAEMAPKTIWLKARETHAFPIAEAVTSVAEAASSASVTGVLGGADAGMDLSAVRLPPGVNDATWVWVTRATPPAPVLTTRRPSFYVTYGEVPGLDSREWAPYVVRLSAAGQWRVLTALAGPAIARNDFQIRWEIRKTIVQDEMAAAITGLADGMVRVTLKGPLVPGEYAVVIRPAFARRAYAGRTILGDTGPGVAFGAAWVFGVK